MANSMDPVVSPGMGKVLAAMGICDERGPIRPPVLPAVMNLRSGDMQARGKYSSETSKKILQLIGAGNCREVACAAIGITRNVLGRWLKFGHQGEQPFASFVDEMDKAEGTLEAHLVATVRQAAAEDPSMALRLLERRFPERWGSTPQQQVSINIGQQLTPTDARSTMRELFGDLGPPALEVSGHQPESVADPNEDE